MTADSASDDLIGEVRQRLGDVKALQGAMKALEGRVPDFEAQFPGALGAARSMAETMTGVLAGLPSPEQVKRLVTALVQEVAPPVDAAAFRAELEQATSELLGVVDSLAATLPEAPEIDTRRLASLSGDALGKVPDPVLAQIGGLVKALDLPAVAARAAELVALAKEVKDGVLDEDRLGKIRDAVIKLRAGLQIAAKCLAWSGAAFPFSGAANGFVVVKFDLHLFGVTASQLALYRIALALGILRATFLILLIGKRLEQLEEGS